MSDRRQVLLLTVGTVAALAAGSVAGGISAGHSTRADSSNGAVDCGTYTHTGTSGADTWTVRPAAGRFPDVTTGTGRTGKVTGHREYTIAGYTFTVGRYDLHHKEGTWRAPDGATGTFTLDRLSREGC